MGRPSNYCSFQDCKNTSDLVGLHFYRFPKDKNRCQAWIDACKNRKLIGIPHEKLNNSARVCSNHFHDWCFMNRDKKDRLVHNAIPGELKPRPVVHKEVKYPLKASTKCIVNTTPERSLNEQIKYPPKASECIVITAPEIFPNKQVKCPPKTSTECIVITTPERSPNEQVKYSPKASTECIVITTPEIFPNKQITYPPKAPTECIVNERSPNEQVKYPSKASTECIVITTPERSPNEQVKYLPKASTECIVNIPPERSPSLLANLLLASNFPNQKTFPDLSGYSDRISKVVEKLKSSRQSINKDTSSVSISSNITKTDDKSEIVKNTISANINGSRISCKSENTGINGSEMDGDLSNCSVSVNADSHEMFFSCVKSERGDSDESLTSDSRENDIRSFNDLARNLNAISKPNELWGITVHDTFMMCAKWKETYVLEKRVVIDRDLKVKVFLENAEIGFEDAVVSSVEQISSLLYDVDSFNLS